MCGIVGYIGPRRRRTAARGLKRLEYRGYDSSGIAIVNARASRSPSRGEDLRARAALNGDLPAGTVGIAHTRWATHGAPTTPNAHSAHRPVGADRGDPQRDHRERVRHPEGARAAGARLQVRDRYRRCLPTWWVSLPGQLEEAVAAALRDVDGAYGLAFVCATSPACWCGAKGLAAAGRRGRA